MLDVPGRRPRVRRLFGCGEKEQSRTQASPRELVLGGGQRLIGQEDFDAEALRRLMGALAGR